jgi:hypothetical protein
LIKVFWPLPLILTLSEKSSFISIS